MIRTFHIAPTLLLVSSFFSVLLIVAAAFNPAAIYAQTSSTSSPSSSSMPNTNSSGMPVASSYNNNSSTNIMSNTTNNCFNFYYGNFSKSDYYLSMACTNSVLNNTGIIKEVRLASSNDGWHVAIALIVQPNSNSSQSDIYVVSSNNGGNTFNNRIKVASAINASNIDIGIASEDIYVKWDAPPQSNTTNNDLFFAYSLDGGITFYGPLNISNSPENTVNTQLNVNSITGKVLLTWTDRTVMFELIHDHPFIFCGRC